MFENLLPKFLISSLSIIVIAIIWIMTYKYLIIRVGDNTLTPLYIYKEIENNNVDVSNIELINTEEFYLFELFAHTGYKFWAVGGWIRDIVNLLFILLVNGT